MNREIKQVGYKIMFSTRLTRGEIESKIDSFLKEVDSRDAIAHVSEMNDEEIVNLVHEF
jgi:hypothetical protein